MFTQWRQVADMEEENTFFVWLGNGRLDGKMKARK